MKKKLLVGILVLTMLVACLSVSAAAEATPATTAEALAKAIASDTSGYDKQKVKVDNNTVTLLANIDQVTTDVAIYGGNNSSLILDLGEHTLTLGGTQEMNNEIVLLQGANLTIKGQKGIISTNGQYATIAVYGGSSLTVESSVTIENKYDAPKEPGENAVGVAIGAPISEKNPGGGKITINGATVTGLRGISVDAEGSTLTVEEGSNITGNTYNGIMIQGNAEVTVNGGAIKGGPTGVYVGGYDPKNETTSPGHLTVNGGTIEGTSNDNGDSVGVFAYHDSTAIISDGEVKGHTGVRAWDGAEVEIKGSAKITGTESGVDVYGYPEENAGNNGAAKVTISGGTVNGRYGAFAYGGGQLTVSGGEVTGQTAGIGTNGSDVSEETQVTVTGGTVKGTTAGVYLPAGKMTVDDNAKIEGKAGIVVRGGDLSVEGGTITATGTGDVTIGDATQGGVRYTVPAAGITVDNAGYPSQVGGQKHVTVTDGATITAVDGGKTVAATNNGTAVEATSGTSGDKVAPKDNFFDIQGGKLTVNDEPDENVNAFLRDGYKYDETNGVQVDPDFEGTFVAKIGDQMYTTFEEAMNSATADDVVQLLADADMPGNEAGEGRIEVTKKITLDLNGFTLSKSDKLETEDLAGLKVGKGGELTITDTAEGGKVDGGKVTGVGTLIASFGGGKITLDGCTIEQTAAKESDKTNNAAVDTDGTEGAEINVKGYTLIFAAESGVGVHGKATVNIEGGKIDAGTYGVVTNGAENYKGSTVNITGGEIYGEYAGMYLPSQGGTTTITGDVTIKGTNGAGVVVRGGTIEVKADEEGNAPTITASGDKAQTYGDDEEVELPAGALVVDKNDGYGSSDTKATLSAGTFEAAKGQPSVTYVEKGEEPTEDPTTGVEIEIENLTDITLKSGDTGDYKAAKYLGDASMTINEKGNPDLRDENSADAFFTIPNSYGRCVNYYPDFESAVAALDGMNGKPANTIYVNRSVELDEAITVDKEITIALSPERVEENPVISAAGRVIEVKDNGGKLTLDGVTIVSTDGTPDVADNVAAIKVSGELTVKAGTSITADATAIFVAGNTGKLTMTGGDVKSNTEIAIGTNGSLTQTGATITISGGTVTGADTASGVYVPAGELEVSGDAAISGGAGIVARGAATVTVKADDDGIAPTVTATGDGTVTVGDSTKEIPAKAVVSDGASQNPSVSAGTFEANGNPDYSVLNYVDTATNGVDETGSVKAATDELFIVDFGYIANKADLESDDEWTSPNGIVYKVGASGGKWGDATFYWSFNRALKEDEKITVTLTCDGKEFTDTCEAQAIRFAASLKNKDQFGDDLDGAPITGGDFTLSSKDGKFTVDEELATVQVTLPAADTADAPVIDKAPVVHHGDEEMPSVSDYTVAYTSVDNEGKTYSVVIDATNVSEHLNENGDYGYWVGMTVKYDNVPSGANGYYVKVGNGDWQYSGFDTIAGDANKYAIFYFGDISVYNFKLVWTTDREYTEDSVSKFAEDVEKQVMTFTVSTEKVEHGESLRPRPVGGGAPTTTSKVTTPENGSVELSSTTARGGQTVTVTATPDEGYDIGDVIVKDRNGNPVEVTRNDDGTYSYTVPAGKTPVTVEVVFDECLCDDFADLDLDEWYHEAVDYAIKNELMLGQGDGFAPSAPVRRAEIAVILGRMEGKGFETGGEHWYDESLAWAQEEGITDGTDPLRDCKREEVVTMLWRYMDKPESDADLSAYVDADQVDDWALDAMKWAVETGIIQGRDNNDLQPTDTLTRAEFATILERIGATVAE